MHNITAFLVTDHRLSRFAAWGRAALAWLVVMLFSDAVPDRRRRKRYRWLTLDRLSRYVACLIVMRAAKLAHVRRPAPTIRRPDNVPHGFARRMPTPKMVLRAGIGSKLRRRLRPKSLSAQLAILCAALRDLDSFAVAHARRFRRPLARLTPLVPVHPPAQTARSVAAPCEPCAADTS